MFDLKETVLAECESFQKISIFSSPFNNFKKLMSLPVKKLQNVKIFLKMFFFYHNKEKRLSE